MTCCGKCNKEIENEKCREHTLSQKLLERAGKIYCEICKMTYYNSIKSKDSQILYERRDQHTESDVHKQNANILSYYGRQNFYIFIFTIS